MDVNKPVMISGRWHEGLHFVAGMRRLKTGRKYSLKELIEIALEEKYGSLDEIQLQRDDLHEPGEVQREWARLVAEDWEELFARMVEASVLHSNTNEYVEKIPDHLRLPDHMGRRDPGLSVRNLAYYLRTTKAAPKCLRDLLIAYAYGH